MGKEVDLSLELEGEHNGENGADNAKIDSEMDGNVVGLSEIVQESTPAPADYAVNVPSTEECPDQTSPSTADSSSEPAEGDIEDTCEVDLEDAVGHKEVVVVTLDEAEVEDSDYYPFKRKTRKVIVYQIITMLILMISYTSLIMCRSSLSIVSSILREVLMSARNMK